MKTHEDMMPLNRLKTRTLGAIALGPDDSLKYGYYF